MENLTENVKSLLSNLIKSGVRSNELSILLGTGVSIDEINAAVSGKTGIFELIKLTRYIYILYILYLNELLSQKEKDFEVDLEQNYPLIHPRYHALKVFHEVSATNFHIIQTHAGNLHEILSLW